MAMLATLEGQFWEGYFTCHMKRRLLALLMSITPSRPAPTKSWAGVRVMVSPELAIVPIAYIVASVSGYIELEQILKKRIEMQRQERLERRQRTMIRTSPKHNMHYLYPPPWLWLKLV